MQGIGFLKDSFLKNNHSLREPKKKNPQKSGLFT